MQGKGGARCVRCLEEWPAEQLTVFFCGDRVCPSCLKGYLQEQSGRYVEAFVETAPQDYYRSWWFDSLPPCEQLEVLRVGYQSRLSVEREALAEDRMDFCRERSRFLSFVQKRLK